MELRYFLIFCLFYSGQCFENDKEVTKSDESDEMSKSIPLSIRSIKNSEESIEKDSSSDEKSSDESIDRSPTNHLPTSYSHAHRHSPYVQMVFKLASEAVEASEASQRISHQLSMNHAHGHSEEAETMMVKVRVPLYKQSYPVLFQHGHVMHDVMDGLPYPYVPTMKARPSTILHGQRNSNSENHSAENSNNLISYGLALVHRQQNAHQAPHY